MNRDLLKSYLLCFFRPETAFANILKQPDRQRFASFCIIATAGLYSLMYVFLVIAGAAPSTFTPWLNIERENYYYYNQFLLAPSMFLCWILTSGFIQIASNAAGGKGSFENTVALAGVSISVAMWPTLIHDLSTSFLSAINVLNAQEHEIAMNTPTIWRTILWICMSLYVVLFFVLFTKTVKVNQQISSAKSTLIGVLAFILFQTVFLVFNR